MTNEEIGRRITEAREDAGYNQKQLANKLHVYPSTIGRYERGEIQKISMVMIEAIAKVVSVNPMWLIGKSEHREIKDMLEDWKNAPPSCPMNCTDHEKDLIRKYRCLPPPVQNAVDTMIEGQYELVRPKLKSDRETS